MSDKRQVTPKSQTSEISDTSREADSRRAVLPAVDVFEDASGITLLADMPGVSKDRLELRVEGDSLSIEGSMQPQTPDGLEAVYAEVRIPRFRRSFTLSPLRNSSRFLIVRSSISAAVVSDGCLRDGRCFRESAQ